MRDIAFYTSLPQTPRQIVNVLKARVFLQTTGHPGFPVWDQIRKGWSFTYKNLSPYQYQTIREIFEPEIV